MSIRYYFRLSLAYITRFKGIILIGVILGLIFYLVFFVIFSNLFKHNIERIGVPGRYHANEIPRDILDLIGDGLTKLNDEQMVEPALAESWATPDKGKTWIFHFDQKISWQDGVKVESNSINYDFPDVTVERPDQKTIVFKLEEPFSPFPSIVSSPIFRKGLLGTGEWRVKKMTMAGSFVHELILINSKKDKKIYRFYPTLERTKLAYKLGEVDILENIIDPSPFLEWKTASIKPNPNFNQVVTIFFNNNDPKLSEKSLRQALIYAIDKDALGVRAISPISPTSWAFNPQVKPYTYDKTRAKKLLEELPEEIKKDLVIKLDTSPILLPVAERVAKNWEDIGIKTQITIATSIPEKYQAYMTIFDIPKDPDQYPLWHTTQKNSNITKITNARIDSLLESGRKELDLEERRKIYLDFQRFLLEEAPAAFLYHPTYYTVVRK